MKNLFLFLIAGVLITAFAFVVRAGIAKSEQNECYKWQNEAKLYAGYYLTNWQIEQCEYYSINLK